MVPSKENVNFVILNDQDNIRTNQLLSDMF